MAFDSPPPLDACPELTPDNGTPTSSASGSVYRSRITHHVEEDTGNNQIHGNALYIFDNVNHQTSSSGNNAVAEHNNVPAREGQISGPHHPRSPYPATTVPPRPGPRSLVPTAAISPLEIGSPLLPLPFDPHPARVVRFVSEPTAIHSSTPSSSRCPTINSKSGSPPRGVQGRCRWLRAALSNFSGWFGRESRGNGNGARPKPRRRLSLAWFARRRNAAP